MAIKTQDIISKQYVCDDHGNIQSEDCPYCDKCEHGVTRYGECKECLNRDGLSWVNEPLTKDEFRQLVGSLGSAGVYRHSPFKRQFRVTAVVGHLLREYAELKGWTDVKIRDIY